jgi:hypothetical protein
MEHVTASAAGRGQKRGPKEGSTRSENSAETWYMVCSLKESTEAYKNMSGPKFLQSSLHGTDIKGSESECKSFQRYLKKFRNGELQPTKKKRARASPYHAVEKKLIDYVVETRSHLFQTDNNKCAAGLNWSVMRDKLMEWAAQEDQTIYKNFQASPGFIARVLKDNTPPISSSQAMSSLHELRRYGRSIGLTEDDTVLLDQFQERISRRARLTKVAEQRTFPSQQTLTTFFAPTARNNSEDSDDISNII